MNSFVAFDSDQFNRIFPFYLLLDEKLSVVSCGKTIRKIMPGICGKSFSDFFGIKRPEIHSLDFSVLKKLVNQLIIVECNCLHKMMLRGQLELLDGNSQLLFMGSPWFGSMEQVVEHNLKIDDFALHDPMIDLLHVIKAQEITTEDLKKLLLKINKQKEDLKKASKEISDLALFPMQNPDPILRINMQGEILVLNPAAANLSSYRYKERGYSATEFWHEISASLDASREKTFISAESGGRLFSFIIMSLPNHGYFNIYGRDISEERVIQEQLRVLSSIAAENTHGVVIADREGRIEWANRSFEKMSGYSIEELKGRKPGSLLQGKDTDMQTVKYLREQIKNGEPFVCEILNYKKSGEPYWLRLQGQALKDKEGNVLKYFSIEEDVTRIRESEKALRESEAKYRDLVENISEIVYEIDETGGIRYISPSVEKLLKYSQEEIIGKNFKIFLGFDDDLLVERLNSLADKKILISEYRLVDKTGQQHWLQFSTKAVFKDGVFKGGSGTIVDITELKTTQFELERLSLVARTNRLGVHFTDSHRIISYSNEALLRMTGYTSEELIGRSPVELFHGPLTQESGIVELTRGHEEVVPVDVDIILYRKDRSWFWANVKKQPLGKSAQGVQEFFSILEDITDKKRIEENLRNSESRLASLIQNLKEGVLLEDEYRRIVITNENFCSMFSIPVSPVDLTGADCSRSAEQNKDLFRHPDLFVQSIHQILEEKKTVLSEELELADGRFFERDYIPIIINENLKGHLWKYTDITERKIQEKQLMNKEEKYRNIIANMKMGLLETNNDDVIEYVNQQFSEMTGYSPDEILGKNTIDLLIADEYKQVVRDKRNLRLDGLSDNYEVQVKIKSGEVRWWLTSGGPNYNDRGELIGTIGISVDITEQKALEDELKIARMRAEESSKAKESFLANMSHEIRTPLNAIIGLIREISREPLTPKQSLHIRHAGLAGQHLLSIVNNILDITKIESGQLSIENSAFNLREVIQNAVSILTPSAAEKNLKLTTKISRSIFQAYMGDSSRIKQILLNILSNAIKFTDKGRISVECKVTSKAADHHCIMLSVADTGIGIDESYLERVFDKFSQEEISTARKFGGTGLGLAITRELVQLMNGKILVTSQKGVGTKFVIQLDLETAPHAATELKSTPENFQLLKNRQILVVEDNDLNRLVVQNLLSHYGMDVTEATNGAQSIKILKKKTFDLILMDLQMQVMDGLTATKIIRDELRLDTPIIALTANAFKAEKDRCLEAGMNDYITKPFEEDALLGAIFRNIPDLASLTLSSEDKSNMTENLYNLDYIVQFSRGNPEFVKKMIRLFIDQMPAAVNDIKNALKEVDSETISRTAHRIKPNIDNFGIEGLKQGIRSIESMAKEGNLSHELDLQIRNLEDIISRVIPELEKELYRKDL